MSHLQAHRFTDALLGRSKLFNPVKLSDAHRAELALLIARSEKFYFDAVPFERDDPEKGTWVMPNLTDDEAEFFRQGLIPLPAPVAWYEFALNGEPVGILIEETPSGAWAVRRFDLGRLGVTHDGITLRVKFTDELITASFATELARTQAEAIGEALPEQALSNVAAVHVRIAAYLTLMLTSRTTVIERGPTAAPKVHAPDRIEQLAAHRIVRIVPERYLYERDEASGRTHASPRLHWRRSHLRRYADGRTIVIARMLVGRAELGEVSHEYLYQSHRQSKEEA